MKEDRILIVGSTSFLGSHLVSALLPIHKNVLLVNRGEELEHSRKADLLDISSFQRIIKDFKPLTVFHLGAHVNLKRDYKEGTKCIQTNIQGTLNLLEALRQYPPKKLIYTSTEEIYGQNTTPFHEAQIPQPPSPYSISKLSGEYLCKLYAHELKFSLVTLRIATMYGPGKNKNRFIPAIIYHALHNEDIALNSGLKKRDYVYVEDVVQALLKTYSINLKNQIELINIGGGKAYTLKKVVQLILNISKSKSKILFNALPERAQESDKWLLDISHAYSLLKWKPKTSIEDGLQKTIDYCKVS